ncbi:MAG TPA: hypothetical protein VGM29_15090 [Polyangiaceae bacterium]|jgi:hypothetical protein
MGLNLAPLLIYSEQISPAARDALRAAHTAPPAERQQALEFAARTLHREADLSCRDACEIVGLDAAGCE